MNFLKGWEDVFEDDFNKGVLVDTEEDVVAVGSCGFSGAIMGGLKELFVEEKECPYLERGKDPEVAGIGFLKEIFKAIWFCSCNLAKATTLGYDIGLAKRN